MPKVFPKDAPTHNVEVLATPPETYTKKLELKSLEESNNALLVQVPLLPVPRDETS